LKKPQTHSTHFTRLLAERAATMRGSLTASEAALWQLLSARRLGVQFRRQVVIGRYIVDFYAPVARLAVEVDGGCHHGRTRADARRDRQLQRLGVAVLRLPAALVLGCPAEAVVRVQRALAAATRQQ